MFLKKSFQKSTGKTQLSIVQGYRENNKVKHKVVKSLGFLEDYLDQYSDPIAHFKQLAREMSKKDVIEKIEITLSEQLPNQCNNRKNLGYAFIKDIYSKLHIREFFQSKQNSLNIKFNLNSIFSLLVFNRFLFPSSKKNAFERKDIFFENYKFSLDDVYHSLDYFYKYSNALQKHLHEEVSTIVSRDTSLGYYDVTNYYFEIPYEDENEYDTNGNITKIGYKKRGPSKEHRKDPIVQMGLLMDTNGIPMAFNTFSGGESEKTTMLPAIARVKRDYGIERVIVVADRGLNTSDNTAYLSGINHDDMHSNDGYIYGQSILGGSKEFKEWVLKQDEYINQEVYDENGEKIIFRHKSRIIPKEVTLKDSHGNRRLKTDIYQKQMVYYSEKYAKKQCADRERIVQKARDMINNPGQYTRATSYGAAGYINNISFEKSTGVISDGQDLSINEERITYEKQFDGYYSIVTSELRMNDLELQNKYKGLWEIEENFRIIKSEFNGRPIFVRTREHIDAHFLICFTTLVILRVMEKLTGEKHTVKNIRNALCNYGCSHLDQNYYLFDYRDKVLCDFEKIFGFNTSKKIMSLKEIKNIVKYNKESDKKINL